MDRGFHVSLDLSFAGAISGHTQITIVPTDANLKTVYLHARELYIRSVSINEQHLTFSHSDPLVASSRNSTFIPTQADSIKNAYPELKRKFYAAASEADEGELAILLPEGSVRETRLRSESVVVGTPAPTPQPSQQQQPKQKEFDPITLTIQYEVRNSNSGLRFVGANDHLTERVPHIFTTGDAARSWVPCIDDIWARCTWELDFVVQKYLTFEEDTTGEEEFNNSNNNSKNDKLDNKDKNSSQANDNNNASGQNVDNKEENSTDINSKDKKNNNDTKNKDGISRSGGSPVFVVASGDLQERVAHPSNSDQVIFSYTQGTPASAHHIGFAAGPFETIDLSPSQRHSQDNNGDDEDNSNHNDNNSTDPDQEIFEDTDQPSVRAFCLAGRYSELVNSISFASRAMEFFVSEYGSYPFGSYKLVFVDETTYTSFNTAALSIFTSDLLYPPSVIEQGYQTRQVVTTGLASQWVGVNIIQRTWADTWLINGLCLYISSLFLRQLLGNNEYRLRLKKDILRCCTLDIRMPPLCQPGIPYPPPSDIIPFMNLKSPLVLHILDRQLLRSGTSMGLNRVIPKVFISSISGDLRDNLLSTTNFFRTCRKVSGAADLKLFADQWIYSSGCPRFTIKATFNRKKMAVEMGINQDCPGYGYATSKDSVYTSNLSPVKLFEGVMTIRIHEADGTPYEHVLDIRDQYKRHDVPFNTKYKRVRRNTKRFQMRQAAAVAAAQGDTDAAEDLGLVDMGFGLGTWEEESEREKWRVADWTEEDDQIMSQATYEWIRIDPDLDWICTISFEQPDYMWISQLQRDRDVVAQLDSVHALGMMPSPVVSSNLTRTVLVNNYFFRIRAEAALMLSSCARPDFDFIGLFHLFKLFKSRYCFDPHANIKNAFDFKCIPRPNDFSDIAEYFVSKAIISAISAVRDEKGSPYPKIQQFLIELLTFNDNSRNPYSDAFYISSIMNNLSNCLISFAPQQTSEFYQVDTKVNSSIQLAIDEIERYLSMDRLVSSYHNVITQAGLNAKAKLMMASELPVDSRIFLPYTRDGNYIDVRTTAFNCLLLLGNFTHPLLLNYFFAVLQSDSSILLKRRLAQSLIDSFPVLVELEDLGHLYESKNGGLIEDDVGQRKADAFDFSRIKKALRKEVGRTVGFKELLLASLISPDLDLDVRWAIFKLCENFIKPGNEPLPKVNIQSGVFNNIAATQQQDTIDHGGIPAPSAAPIQPPPPAISSEMNRNREESPEQPLRLSLITNKDKTTKTKTKKQKSEKPNKPAPQQKKGLLVQEKVSCQRVQRKIWNADQFGIFHTAVDPVKHNAPHYFDIIKNPMDLSVTAYKLDNGEYNNRQEYWDDIKLMVNNAKTYNRPGQRVYQIAEKIDELFNKEWAKIEKSLAKIEQRAAANNSNKDDSGPTTNNVTSNNNNNNNDKSNQQQTQQQQSSNASTVKLSLSKSTDKKGIEPTTQTPPPPALSSKPGAKSSKQNAAAQNNNNNSQNGTVDSGTPKGISLKLKTNKNASTATPTKMTPGTKSNDTTTTTTATPTGGSAVSSKIALGSASAGNTNTATPRPILKLKSSTNSAQQSSNTPEKKAQVVDAKEKTPKEKTPKQKTPKAQQTKQQKQKSKTPTPTPTSASTTSTPAPQSPAQQPQVTLATPAAKAPPPATPKENGGGIDNKRVALETPLTASPSVFQQPSSYQTPQQLAPLPPKLDQDEMERFKNYPINVKKARSVLKTTSQSDFSYWFREPVDPNLAPGYYDEIKNPIDLRTMNQKLDRGDYNVFNDIFADFNLLVANCRVFNPPGTEPTIHSHKLENVWTQAWKKALKLSNEEKAGLKKVHEAVWNHPNAVLFHQAVDPYSTDPYYFDVIPQSQARDLSLIRNKLTSGKYDSAEDYESDMRLMFANGRTFNGPESEVALVWTPPLEEILDKEMTKYRNGLNTKRKNDGDGRGKAKKARVG